MHWRLYEAPSASTLWLSPDNAFSLCMFHEPLKRSEQAAMQSRALDARHDLEQDRDCGVRCGSWHALLWCSGSRRPLPLRCPPYSPQRWGEFGWLFMPTQDSDMCRCWEWVFSSEQLLQRSSLGSLVLFWSSTLSAPPYTPRVGGGPGAAHETTKR